MSKLEKWLTAVMVVTAALGTIWYVILELQTNEIGAIGWSLIVVIWFIIIRRLVYLWPRQRPPETDDE
jgi:hypothetical protein